MINVMNEVINQKTMDQYKVIEDRYLTLKKYLRLQMQKHSFISAEDIEMIIKSLEDEPIEKDKEKKNNE